jgi:hypothetical protein
LSEYHSIETDASPNESSLRFVAQSCENVIPLLKGPSFYEETEERLYVWANPRQILDHINKPGTFKGKTEIGTTIRGDHKLATHIALPVIARNKNEQDKDHVTLCRVIIGPRCEASKTEVTTMLRQSGIDEEEIDVAYSQSPYTG